MIDDLAAGQLHLGKYHGLGNDFLVWLTDASTAAAVDLAGIARRLCDRHHGVGADGLLVGTPVTGAQRGAGDPIDITMVLHNADGSRAEMSGNGIRCFVHAVARDAGMDEGQLRVATDAGVRTVTFSAADDLDGDPGAILASVDMGAARPGPEPDTEAQEPAAGPEATPRRQATVDVGNPHLVLLVDEPAKVDVVREGPGWEARYSAGINVHFVSPADDGASLAVHTWERGAGPTEACGTGAVAAAHVVHQWGLVGDRPTVRMPGGEVEVALGATITLAGPSVWIADVAVPCPGGRP